MRRSVEAVQEYNAGLESSEQFSIPRSLLRQLAKVKLGKVKDGMSDLESELTSYSSGFASRQNTGKSNPRSVIKWSEQGYRAHDW